MEKVGFVVVGVVIQVFSSACNNQCFRVHEVLQIAHVDDQHTRWGLANVVLRQHVYFFAWKPLPVSSRERPMAAPVWDAACPTLSIPLLRVAYLPEGPCGAEVHTPSTTHPCCTHGRSNTVWARLGNGVASRAPVHPDSCHQAPNHHQAVVALLGRGTKHLLSCHCTECVLLMCAADVLCWVGRKCGGENENARLLSALCRKNACNKREKDIAHRRRYDHATAHHANQVD